MVNNGMLAMTVTFLPSLQSPRKQVTLRPTRGREWFGSFARNGGEVEEFLAQRRKGREGFGFESVGFLDS
jgi:hypothetical protein